MSEFYAPSMRELLDSGVERFGNSPFINYVVDGEICKKGYEDLRTASYAVCRCLRDLSKKKMNIAIIGKTSYEFLACFTGIIISGNVAIPFAPEISVKEAASIFARADIDMLIYSKDFAEKAEELSDACQFVSYFVPMIDKPTFEHVLDKYSDTSEFASLSDIEVNKKDCSVIIFTSGTTGVKKGVMLSEEALIGNITYKDNIEDAFRSEDVSLSVLPMHHIFCFSGDFIKNLKDGVQICLNGDFKDTAKNLLIFQPRVMRLVPMLADSLLRRVKLIMSKEPDISVDEARERVFGKNLKWLISGGAYLNPTLVEEYEKIGISLRQGYGMSEAGCRISVPDMDISKDSVGKIVEFCDVRIKDGEIQIKTPTVMLGYYKMPEQTAEMFTDDGWLRTGDIGYVSENRELFITGRAKNLIILSSGENVSPEAIEKKFAFYPIISEVMVYAENDRIVAEFFPDKDYAARKGITDIEAEISRITAKLNSSAKASHIIAMTRIRETPFEKTESGKIKRKATVIK